MDYVEYYMDGDAGDDVVDDIDGDVNGDVLCRHLIATTTTSTTTTMEEDIKLLVTVKTINSLSLKSL